MAWGKAESGDSMDGGTPPRTRAVSLALATSALRAIARLRRRATMAVIKLNLFILLLSLFGPQARPGSAAR